MDQEDRNTILVTGASRGIGRAIAVGLAAQGYDIVVHYGRDEASAAQTLDELCTLGARGRLLGFDVSDRDESAARINADIAEHGA